MGQNMVTDSISDFYQFLIRQPLTSSSGPHIWYNTSPKPLPDYWLVPIKHTKNDQIPEMSSLLKSKNSKVPFDVKGKVRTAELKISSDFSGSNWSWLWLQSRKTTKYKYLFIDIWLKGKTMCSLLTTVISSSLGSFSYPLALGLLIY